MTSPPVDNLHQLRLSSESARSTSIPLATKPNGHDRSLSLENGSFDASTDGVTGEETLESLRAELERTRAEKDALGEQYSGLLAKLTAMRTTLGNKLKEDAVRLRFLPASRVLLMRGWG